MLKFGLGLSVALSLGLLVGCTSKNPTAPASISGKVTYNSKTVGGGTIIFHAKEGKGTYRSAISTDGTYEITDLPIGPMVVTVETESANPKKKGPDYSGGKGSKINKEYAEAMRKMGAPMKQASGGDYVRIPEKYNNAKTSPLQITIEEGRQVKEWPLAD